MRAVTSKLSLIALAALVAMLCGSHARAEISNPGSYDQLRYNSVSAVKTKLAPLLDQYCHDACQLIDVLVEIEESFTETEDIGFEGVTGDDIGDNLKIAKLTIDLQIDDRVTSANRDRLQTILKNNLGNAAPIVEISWRPVTLPQIGQSAAKEEQLKRQLQQRLSAAIDKVIDAYCPEECVLSQIAVDGKLITADEASGLTPEELVTDKTGTAILKIDAVDVEVGMDSKLESGTRNKIMNVMKAKTRFAAPVAFDLQVSEFPESYAKKQEKLAEQSKDPFGLGKLRETLTLFRELAGTKEVITTTQSNNSSTNATELNATSNNKESASLSSSKAGEGNTWEWPLYIAGLIVVTGLMAFVILRFASANRDARLMMEAADASRPSMAAPAATAKADARGLTDEARRDMSLRMKNEEIREEMIRVFLDAPKVAKETFTRLLQEEGVEDTARYVHIFGHLVIFELLDDPNLQRDLYELSEYYHKSSFVFDANEENRLLQALKTRVTANEIRVLTRRQTEKFDFLTKLDAGQIYNLIAEEKPQIQSIVLTQLDHKRRRGVFEMYTGQPKVELMRELCRADAIPKEYLSNVAKALHKKVSSRPEFDTEHLRSSDILLDLLEKAALTEQRALMTNLVQTNPEAARGIKLKLVTVEIMPYLKDGHLLEIVLGMERDDLMTFLAGTREHVRALILGKAPEELAEGWIEDLANVKGFDEQRYRLVEMKVLSRIRALANNGVVNLLDLNEMIFASSSRVATNQGDAGEVVGIDSPSSMVA